MAGTYITGNCEVPVVGCNQEISFASYNAGEEVGYEDDVISGQQENGETVFAIDYAYFTTTLYMDTADGSFDGDTASNITVSYNEGENIRVMSFDAINGYYRSYESAPFFETYALAGTPVGVCITSGGSLPG